MRKIVLLYHTAARGGADVGVGTGHDMRAVRKKIMITL